MTPPVFSWRAQKAVGQMGEKQVLDWLQSAGYFPVDVSDNAWWQQRDIDALVTDHDDHELTVEIKTDTHAPKNLFLETEVDGKPGYLFKTRADVLLYYFPKTGQLYWIPVPQLLQHLWDYGMALEERTIQNPRYTCTGVLLPLERISHFSEVYDLSAKQEAA